MRLYCSLPVNQIIINRLLRVTAYPVNSEICSRRSGGNSSPSSCLSYTCSYRGGSASRRLWRCGTRPAPRDRWPRWSCSPCPPRTASWCGTWYCRCTPSDIVHWPLRSPGGRAGRVGCCHPSRWAASLGFTRQICFHRADKLPPTALSIIIAEKSQYIIIK